MNSMDRDSFQSSPKLLNADDVIQKAYTMALVNLLQINTVPCPMDRYNRTGLLSGFPGLMIRAGGFYEKPWTRDAAINCMNAASLLQPRIARDTLLAVCEKGESALCVQTDNQYWDKVIWAWGAWEYYLTTGDLPFLNFAHEIITNTLAHHQVYYNDHFGLYRGGSCFNDGIAGYPSDLYDPSATSDFMGNHPAVQQIMSLSVNCLYWKAYDVLANICRILGKDASFAAQKADTLKNSILYQFYDGQAGRLRYLVYPDGRYDDSQEGCGICFALIFGLLPEEDAKRVLHGLVRSENGMVSIWPPFPGISSTDAPLRHNNMIWPFINGFLITAAAKYGCTEIVEDELKVMAKLAVESNQFGEVYNAETGLMDGGFQCGTHYRSGTDQTWSATGFLRAIYFGIFGLLAKEDGLYLSPCVPDGFTPPSLNGVQIRNMSLDIRLTGCGTWIKVLTIDGVPAEYIPWTLSGQHTIEVHLSGETP